MSPSDLTCFGIYLYLTFIVLLLLLLSLISLLKGNSDMFLSWEQQKVWVMHELALTGEESFTKGAHSF